MSDPRSRQWAFGSFLGVALIACAAGCHEARHQPSILLFVFDTTRVDAVSAYGVVADTTPTLDALAAGGLRYTRAYAQAPWTLPSHATLFTGLRPSQHGVGWQNVRAANGLTMLAELLHDAGYETVGVSENIWISETFNMVQGFGRFVSAGPRTDDVNEFVRAWAHERRPGRPFFLFVNVVDAHPPYPSPDTDGSPDSPPVNPSLMLERYFCARASRRRELELLRTQYLEGVATADRKLGDVVASLSNAGLADDLITIVTADHGEQLGEHGLVSHQFSVREELLRVPLVVHGLGGVAPAVVSTPVELADVVPTVLGWLGVSAPPGLAGQPIPIQEGAARRAPVMAEFDDIPANEGTGSSVGNVLLAGAAALRRRCDRQQHVFGDMRALLRYPFKLVWYANYPAELYDLSNDPGEKRDLAARFPPVVAQLTAQLTRSAAPRARPSSPPSGGSPPETISPDVVERLRALGYVAPDRRPPPKQ